MKKVKAIICLNELETEERNRLLFLQSQRTRFFSENEFKRLKELSLKFLQNQSPFEAKKIETLTLLVWCPDCLGDEMGCFEGEKIEVSQSADYEALIRQKDEQVKERNSAPLAWEIIKTTE